jgi:hypothetical protein
MAKPEFSIAAFKAWLTDCGAVTLPPTNPYEVLRIQTSVGVLVAYKNKHGVQSWPPELSELRKSFIAGQAVSLSPGLKARQRLRHLVANLAARDGLECWFCENGFLNEESREITIEHLVPRAHGGPNHMSNLVLACPTCNARAGHASVSEKVKLREQLRSYEAKVERASLTLIGARAG